MPKLFVYGTLRQGHANEHVMNNIGGTWQAATIKGTWYEEGWGFEKHGLRGMVVDAEGEQIPGFIFSSDALNDHWATLDAFEGSDYERVEVRAETPEGRVETVYVYALKRA
jgi:gamma-glutamylcyclotransferase (GGCT)/AIG2-like uncharacterized protein YtfP